VTSILSKAGGTTSILLHLLEIKSSEAEVKITYIKTDRCQIFPYEELGVKLLFRLLLLSTGGSRSNQPIFTRQAYCSVKTFASRNVTAIWRINIQNMLSLRYDF
jgi:hypothetical protein